MSRRQLFIGALAAAAAPALSSPAQTSSRVVARPAQGWVVLWTRRVAQVVQVVAEHGDGVAVAFKVDIEQERRLAGLAPGDLVQL